MKNNPKETGAATPAKADGTPGLDPALQADILPFIKELRANNNREWFAEHKPRYDRLRKHLEAMTDACIARMSRFDPELRGLTAKRCMYRIYRDTRFSPDKTPYKRYIGIFICKGGAHGEFSGYYLHLEPGHCAVGAGVYGLQPESMKKIRQHIYFRSADFKKLVLDPAIVKTFGELDREAKMKMPPKGFDKDFPDIEWLKYRHYFLMKPIPDAAVSQLSYIDKVVKYTGMLQPFNAFLNEALAF